MKRGFIKVFVCMLALGTFTASVFAQVIKADFNKINISVNGTVVAVSGENFSRTGWDGNVYTTPYSLLYSGTTYLPVAKVCEFVGREVAWNGETRTVSISTPKTALPAPSATAATPSASTQESPDCTFNSLTIEVSGQVFAMPGENFSRVGYDGKVYTTPYSILYNGTTYLPLTKICELVGKDLSWDAATSTAAVTDRAAIGLYTGTDVPNFGALSKLPKAEESNYDADMVYNYYIYNGTAYEPNAYSDMRAYVARLFDLGYVLKGVDTRSVLTGDTTTMYCYGNDAGRLVVIGLIDFDGMLEMVVSYTR